MDTQTLTEAMLEPFAVPVDRLFRLRPEVYQGMLELELLPAEGVEFVDGLLVRTEVNGSAPAPMDHLYRISLDLYHGLVKHGLLTPDDKLELLDGLLVKKMGKGTHHVVATKLVMSALVALVPAGWHVAKEDPVSLPGGPKGRDSELEPDVSVVRGSVRDYVNRHPGPEDTELAVEVADSSVRNDRAKLIFYARTRVPVAWIVNLIDRTVEVYSRLTDSAEPARYEDVEVYQPGDLVPVVIDGQEVGRVAVNDILP
jgi:Uma2 family endonuclease